MHSDALHTIERIRWKSKDALSYELTIDDPKIFTSPWKQEFEILAKPEWAAEPSETRGSNNRCLRAHEQRSCQRRCDRETASELVFKANSRELES